MVCLVLFVIEYVIGYLVEALLCRLVHISIVIVFDDAVGIL